MHEEYIHKEDDGLANIQNDIAVVEVEKPFPLNDFTIKAARLATQETDIPPGKHVTAVGWGYIGENKTTDILQKVNLEIMNIRQCKKYIRPTIPIDRRVVCTLPRLNGKGTCEGDSGGPLISDGMVVGITSFGGENCIPVAYPSVYTKVAYFRDWIRRKTGLRKIM
ncbi:trypsin-like isoform X2 [Anabrus simplex]